MAELQDKEEGLAAAGRSLENTLWEAFDQNMAYCLLVVDPEAPDGVALVSNIDGAAREAIVSAACRSLEESRGT